jgi:hypothetical protein
MAQSIFIGKLRRNVLRFAATDFLWRLENLRKNEVILPRFSNMAASPTNAKIIVQMINSVYSLFGSSKSIFIATAPFV